jgi:hypothetical protein
MRAARKLGRFIAGAAGLGRGCCGCGCTVTPSWAKWEPGDPTAKELLAQRYARGEIDDDEYFQRLSVLESSGASNHSIDRAR